MSSVRPTLFPVADAPPPADPTPMPPTANEADERAVIGAAILANPDIRAVMLGSYRPSDLTDPRCRFVDDILRRMQEVGTPVDELTVHQFARRHGLLNEGQPRIALGTWLHDTVAMAPVPLSGTWYAAGIVETASRRAVRTAGEELQRVADSASLDELERVVTDQFRTATAAIARAKAAIA